MKVVINNELEHLILGYGGHTEEIAPPEISRTAPLAAITIPTIIRTIPICFFILGLLKSYLIKKNRLKIRRTTQILPASAKLGNKFEELGDRG